MNERFARQRLIDGWDQGRLESALVVIVGVGALGSELARLLALAGVGELVLCDYDVVERTNLNRGGLFRETDAGRPKVEVAAAALGDLAPGTAITTRALPLVNGLGLAELRDASLVASCLDSREGRLQLMSRCALAGAGMLDGGTRAWGGEVAWFAPGGRCFGCWLSPSERAATDSALSCNGRVEDASASGAISALVAAQMATFALRLLMGLPVPDHIVSIDAAGGESRAVHATRDPDCPLHERIDAAHVQQVGLGTTATVGDVIEHLGPGETLFAWAASSSGGIVLSREPSSATLGELGVAPGELLPVTRAEATRYLELDGGYSRRLVASS